jgi:acyl transferase domain-containing protein
LQPAHPYPIVSNATEDTMADPKPLMPIAIVGMSCRLPGNVSNPNEFYRMLCRKRTGWSEVPGDRFNAAAYNHPNPDKKGTFNSAGGYFIKDDISMFDAAFFDITKQEATSMGRCDSGL